MSNIENEFYDCISELVEYYRRFRSKTRLEIADVLGVREDYIRKIHSLGSDKRYSSKHLFLLSSFLGVSVSDLYPTVENLTKLEKYRGLDVEKRREIIEQFKNGLRKEEEG